MKFRKLEKRNMKDTQELGFPRICLGCNSPIPNTSGKLVFNGFRKLGIGLNYKINIMAIKEIIEEPRLLILGLFKLFQAKFQYPHSN